MVSSQHVGYRSCANPISSQAVSLPAQDDDNCDGICINISAQSTVVHKRSPDLRDSDLR